MTSKQSKAKRAWIPAAAHQAGRLLQAAVLQCCYYGSATAQGTRDAKDVYEWKVGFKQAEGCKGHIYYSLHQKKSCAPTATGQGAGVSRFTWPGYWSGRSPAWFLSPVVGPYTNKMKKETHCVTCVCSRKATVRTGRPMVVWMYASC